MSSFLSDADVTPSEYMTRLHDQDDQAGGYNVLCGNIFSGSLWFHSNRAGQGSRELPAGLHAVSNGPMTNEWAKMRRGLDVLPDVLQEIDAACTFLPCKQEVTAVSTAMEECKPSAAMLETF